MNEKQDKLDVFHGVHLSQKTAKKVKQLSVKFKRTKSWVIRTFVEKGVDSPGSLEGK